jgi:hypothetical protein
VFRKVRTYPQRTATRIPVLIARLYPAQSTVCDGPCRRKPDQVSRPFVALVCLFCLPASCELRNLRGQICFGRKTTEPGDHAFSLEFKRKFSL